MMTYPNQPQQYQQPQQQQYQQPQPQQYQQPAQQPAPQPAPVAPPQPAPQPVVPSKAKVLGEQLKRVIGGMGWAVQSDAEIPNGWKLGFKNSSKKLNKGDVINFDMTISAVTAAPPPAAPGAPPVQPQAGSHNIGVATVAKKSFFSKDKKSFTHWIDIANFVGDDMAPRQGIDEQIKTWLIEDGIHKPTPPPAPVAPPAQPPVQPVAQPQYQQPQQPQQPQYQQQAQQTYDQAQQAGYVDQGQQYVQQQAPQQQWPPKPTQ